MFFEGNESRVTRHGPCTAPRTMPRSSLRFSSLCCSCALVIAGLLAGCSSTSPSGDPAGPSSPADTTPSKPSGESEPSKEKPKDPTTALIVGVDAEDFRSQGFLIEQLEIVVKVDGLVAANETLLAKSGALFPHEVKLNAPMDKTDAAVEIAIIARDSPDATMPPIVTRRATTRFVKGTTKLAYVFLETRCNTAQLLGGGGPSGPTCAAPTTCVAGRCVPPELAALSDYRADWATNPPSACGTGTPELSEIGQGESVLAPLPEGATVSLEQGAQCGHHVWLGLRMKNLAQSGTITTISATQPGSAITVPATAYPYAWGASEGGACDLVGIRFQLDTGAALAADFVGKPLDVKVELKDKAGHTATATRRVNIASEVKTIPGRNCGSSPAG